MNISTIADMIREDSTIKDDIPGFLKRMNDKNMRRVDKIRTIVEDVVTFISTADLNGGEATERDVSDAIALINQEPLIQEATDKFNQVISDIKSGAITSSSGVASRFS